MFCSVLFVQCNYWEILSVPLSLTCKAPALYAKQAMSHVPKACELRGNQAADR